MSQFGRNRWWPQTIQNASTIASPNIVLFIMTGTFHPIAVPMGKSQVVRTVETTYQSSLLARKVVQATD